MLLVRLVAPIIIGRYRYRVILVPIYLASNVSRGCQLVSIVYVLRSWSTECYCTTWYDRVLTTLLIFYTNYIHVITYNIVCYTKSYTRLSFTIKEIFIYYRILMNIQS